MTTAIEAIRGELANLRLQVSRLERAEALLAPASQPVESQPPASQHKKTKRVHSSSDRRSSPTSSQVHDHILAHAPLTRGEIVIALGGSPRAIDNKLKYLLANGKIGADGRPGARRYRSPGVPPPRLMPIDSKSKKPASQIAPDRGVYPLYDAISDLNGATTEQLARHTGMPTSLVVEQGRRLMQLGLVRFTGVGKARMWLLVQLGAARDAA